MQTKVILWLALFSLPGHSAKTLLTNSLRVHNAPSWLSERDLRSTTQAVQKFLEWDIRRVDVYWYHSQKSFKTAHSLGPGVLAVTQRKTGKILMGPKVTQQNLAKILGHELAHVILLQKYKSAIPLWLEEGLANYAAKMDRLDYTWLKKQTIPPVNALAHPFRKGKDTKLYYQASTALMHFIARQCPIRDLLQLSVGKSLETYLKTFCEIKDLDSEFRAWLAKKGPRSTAPRP